jgi:lipopolysaccharide/colanic/teichoic acid biosynthesis glycosyltransferase
LTIAKRLFDLFWSVIGLVCLSPLLGVLALLVKISDGGPVFYKARRVGRRGKIFYLLKFRTMVVDADREGAGITNKHDDRITPMGRFLRKTKLDELPQLFNVARGELSLVGPRPEDPRYTALYNTEQKWILEFKPGITSAASLFFKDESSLLSGPNWEDIYVQSVLPKKIALDLEYFGRNTVWSDFLLILKTLTGITKGAGKEQAS